MTDEELQRLEVGLAASVERCDRGGLVDQLVHVRREIDRRAAAAQALEVDGEVDGEDEEKKVSS